MFKHSLNDACMNKYLTTLFEDR